MRSQSPATSGRQQTVEHRFYSGFALCILLTVLLGFSRSFYLKPAFPDIPAPPEPVFLLHGVVFSAWILLLVLQTHLIAAGRPGLHRALGSAGAVLLAAIVPLGIYAGLIAARRPGGFIGVPVPPLQFLIVPMTSLVLFVGFVVWALLRRRDTQCHKRAMLLGTLQMATPAIARWPGLAPFGPPMFFGITDLFLIAMALFDFRSHRRLHPVTLWGGLLTVAAQPAQLVLSGSEAWLGFARWMTSLLG